jgi:hypothetical protein
VLASAIFYFAKLILCDETSEVWITSGNKEPCCENGNLVSLLILFAISLPALQYLSLLGPLLFGPGSALSSLLLFFSSPSTHCLDTIAAGKCKASLTRYRKLPKRQENVDCVESSPQNFPRRRFSKFLNF